MVTLAALAGDPVAYEIITIASEYLGQGLSILIDILNPECIVIGSIYARNEMLFKSLIDLFSDGKQYLLLLKFAG